MAHRKAPRRVHARSRSPKRSPQRSPKRRVRGGYMNPAAQYAAVFGHAVENLQQGGVKAAVRGVAQDAARATQQQLAPATSALKVANAVGLGSVRVPYTPLNVRQASAALGAANAGLRQFDGRY